MTSAISWTEETWNPVVGCTRISEGCRNCYAFDLHDRRHHAFQAGRWPSAPEQYHVPFSQVQVLGPDRMMQPLKWKKPRRVFVCSMADLFHPAVPEHTIQVVYGMMAMTGHEFYVLTKRPGRMASHLEECWPVPLRGVVHGISAEDQATYDARYPILADAPSMRTFLSLEPLLEPIDLCLETYDPQDRPDWIIVGGESGEGYRELDLDALASIAKQADEYDIPLHVKQDSGNLPGKQGRIPDALWARKDGPREIPLRPA